MLQKLLKKIKVTQRSNNGALSNVVQTFLSEIKTDLNNESSRFSVEDAKQLHLSLLILGEGKGASNKWLFYNSNGDMTSNEDVKAIAELCFGNYRLKTQTDASKVHLYKPKGKHAYSPSTGILLSRVCRLADGRTKTVRSRNDTNQSSENEETTDRSSGALPVGSPGRNEGGSGSSRSSAYFSSTESIFSQSPGRGGSLPRETCPWLVNSVSRKSRVDISHRSNIDMFRLTHFMEVLDAESSTSTSSGRNDGSQKTRDDSKQHNSNRCDLGFAVLFQAEDADFARRFRAFFFANYGCIESRMVAMCEALCRVVVVNTANKCTSLCDTGFEKFKVEIHDLVFAPRLMRPIWLAMSSGASSAQPWLYEIFLHRCLLVALDNYNSKSFVTSLVTAVLCHHLAWISTVEPVGNLTGRSSSHALTKQSPDWQEHTPYNPHCAQMNDLYGLLGSPLRLSRTLIVGRDSELIEFFLFFTSYFLRCSNVARRFEELPSPPHPASMELLCVRPGDEEAGASVATPTSLMPMPTGETPTSATTIGCGASASDRHDRTGATTVTAAATGKASIDSGLSSSEDIRSFLCSFPLTSASDRAAPAPSTASYFASPAAPPCSPVEASSGPQGGGECPSSSSAAAVAVRGEAPLRMVCTLHQFEENKAPYLEIPLLFGDLTPRTRGEDQSPNSLEWEDDDDASMSWYSEGHSLLAGVHDHGTSFFALQGTVEPQYTEGIYEQLNDMLSNNGVNEEAVEAVCILVDTDRFSVQEYRLSHGESRPRLFTTHPAKCVSTMLAQVANLARLNLSADMCLRYLEDQLQGIYMNALAYAQVDPPNTNVKALGHDKSDLTLLEAISSVHRPLIS